MESTRTLQLTFTQRFGDIAVVGFLLVQALDFTLTYVGLQIWGPTIEANPLIRFAMSFAGLSAGLAAVKLLAIGLGMLLHLKGIHRVVAFLTAYYVVVAIVPWTIMFLTA